MDEHFIKAYVAGADTAVDIITKMVNRHGTKIDREALLKELKGLARGEQLREAIRATRRS
jgi:hypothetical protein